MGKVLIGKGVSLRHRGCTVTIKANEEGEFECSGDAPSVARARAIMHQNDWTRGRFLSDELFVVRRVAHEIGDCEVVDEGLVVNSLRDGWIQLLRENLLSDPAAHLGKHLDDLTTGYRLRCRVETRATALSQSCGSARVHSWPVKGVVSVGDPTFLHFPSWVRKTSQGANSIYPSVMWERIVSISFSHFSPIPKIVIDSRAAIATHLSDRTTRQGRPHQADGI